jgi:HD-GYP domain-containing protein (c-di-GMP phosphodiesterase class II)
MERTRVSHKPSHRHLYEVPSSPADTQAEAIDSLSRIVAEGAPAVAAHMERTGRLATAFVKELGLGDPLARVIVATARLHDIGKLGVPPWIMEKAAPLTAFEMGVMRDHTLIGQELLERRRDLLPIGTLVRSTHEWWDGSGYPDGLRGAAIPLPSRIVAICDAFDAMTKPRSYSPSMSIQEAMAELQRGAGAQFDPGAVEVFCSLFESRFDRWAKGA